MFRKIGLSAGLAALGSALAVWLAPGTALAGMFEFSIGGSFNRSNYTETSYEWTRKMGGSLGYYFTELSEIEVAFQDVVDRTYIEGYQDTTFHDQVYSVDWSQSITGKQSMFQPFFKVGIGQLVRRASGVYVLGTPPPSEVDSITGILGAGLRFYLTKSFALKGEATTYLTGGALGTWKDNYSTQVGLSIYF